MMTIELLRLYPTNYDARYDGFSATIRAHSPTEDQECLTRGANEVEEGANEYEAKLRSRCRVTGEVYEAVAATIIDSFDSDLLDTFCEMKLGVAAADVTEGMLTAEIEHTVSSIKKDILPDVKSLFKKKLKFNFSESDVEARVVDYSNCFNKSTRENGFVDCFEGTDGTAADPRLFALIVKKAMEHERQCQRLKKSNDKRGDDSRRAKEGKGKKAVDLDHVGTAKKRNHEGKPPHTGARQPRATDKPPQPSASSASGPPSQCPKCKEMHWLRDCPKATESEKEELKKRMRDAKDSKRLRLKRLGESFPWLIAW
ncbi:unnamed protein product [Phytophthora fragariaefolia]|uniref:Unnamed protein product n=1 Tax=Phytophthora fragariaefolia TaxID=1490495 RepID=A0A9W6XXT1_9STRA|nr:unnamed protein product [Phytophthora fragariaefolia]